RSRPRLRRRGRPAGPGAQPAGRKLPRAARDRRGWGTYGQKANAYYLEADVRLAYGQLTLRTLVLVAPITVAKTTITLDSQPGTPRRAQTGSTATLTFAEPLTLKAGQSFELVLE